MYARDGYYHPQLGRFISQDPIGFAGGLNLYAYCGNDPINFTDPLGLSPDGLLGDTLGVLAGCGAGLGEMAMGMIQAGMRYGGPFGLANAMMDGLAMGERAYKCPKQFMNEMFQPFAFWDTDDPFEFGKRFMTAGLTAVTMAEGGAAAGKNLAGKVKVGRFSKNGETLTRFGCEAEATAAAKTGKLSFKEGHAGPDGGKKWVAGPQAKISPKQLGSSYTHKMTIQAKPGTLKWLEQFDGAWKNEAGRFGIPSDQLDMFNSMITNITSGKL